MAITLRLTSRARFKRRNTMVSRASEATASLFLRIVLASVPFLLLVACASNPYEPEINGMEALQARAESQTDGAVTVRVAVPSPEETERLFALPLYERGVQPVWIEVDNSGESELRYAPVGTDPDYVPPFEVAYTHKSGFSSDAYQQMEEYFFSNTMPRFIGIGKVRSGFVFTQARPGTKGVNIDLYGPEATDEYNFIFFVPVPGFVADHAQVDFETLYASEEVTSYDLDGVRSELARLPCCSSDRDGAVEGDPINFVLIGDGDDVLQALLRAGWFERLATEKKEESDSEAAYLFGRTADAVFRTERPGTGDRAEVRLWMAPFRLDDDPVWVGDAIHFVGGELVPLGVDPDLDDARDYLLQDLWYSQGLAQFAWLKATDAIPIDRPKQDVKGNYYFTDGYRVIMWPSGSPVSMLETDYMLWDAPPGR